MFEIFEKISPAKWAYNGIFTAPKQIFYVHSKRAVSK